MTVLGTIGRLVLVPIAFAVATLAALTVLFFLGLEKANAALAGDTADLTDIDAMLSLLNAGLVLTSALSILPALLVVVVGEVGRIRSSLYYTIGGGLTLAAAPLLAGFVDIGTLAMPRAVVWQVMATAGFCGGFVYWLLAGRTA